MVTIAQVQRGVAEFLDREVVPHLQGFEKVVVGAGGGLIAAKLPQIMEKLTENPMLSALGLYNKQSGELDLDAIYGAVDPYIGSEPFSLKIPVVGVTLKMGRQEIRDLYNYIKGA